MAARHKAFVSIGKVHKATQALNAHATSNGTVKPRKFITIAEFCDAYNLSKSYAYKLLKAAKLSGVKVGKTTRISISSVQNWESSLQRYGET